MFLNTDFYDVIYQWSPELPNQCIVDIYKPDKAS